MEPFWPRRSPHFLACRRALRPFDDPAIIGLSGGPDSLALAAAAAAENKDVRCVVVDHGLQDGSAEVAERAAQAVEAFGLEAEVVRVEVGEGNLEASARSARYEALLAYGHDVWVAHTADDLGFEAESLNRLRCPLGNLGRPVLEPVVYHHAADVFVFCRCRGGQGQ